MKSLAILSDLNYLEFKTPEECVKAAVLVSDAGLRHSIMLNNYRYYQLYLKPKSLVLNSLCLVTVCSPIVLE